MATKTKRSAKTISAPAAAAAAPAAPAISLWRIRSSYNGNPLGCYESLTEQQAIEAFIAEMDPAVWAPTDNDVYAELVDTSC